MRRLAFIIIGIVAVSLLAGAAFIGARLLSSPAEEVGGSGNQVVIMGGKGSGGPVQIDLEFQSAPELPPTPPEVAGVFDRREDNSIFVGTGAIMVNMEVDGRTGEKQLNTSYTGAVVEVVVTRETTLYYDETKIPSPTGLSGGKQTVQQVVTPVDSLQELDFNNENIEIQAWGERRGDRLVAQVFVYHPITY